MEMLDAAGPNPTVEQILEAFCSRCWTRTWLSVMPLMGRMLSDPTQFVLRVFKKHLHAGFASVSRRSFTRRCRSCRERNGCGGSIFWRGS